MKKLLWMLMLIAYLPLQTSGSDVFPPRRFDSEGVILARQLASKVISVAPNKVLLKAVENLLDFEITKIVLVHQGQRYTIFVHQDKLDPTLSLMHCSRLQIFWRPDGTVGPEYLSSFSDNCITGVWDEAQIADKYYESKSASLDMDSIFQAEYLTILSSLLTFFQ